MDGPDPVGANVNAKACSPSERASDVPALPGPKEMIYV